MKIKTFLFASVLALLSAPAFAADDAVKEILKPAATPMPAAGPTVTAAQQFCGDPSGKADELITRYSTQKGLKEIYKSVDYVAYGDDDKNPTQVYTFTTKGHAAHPAVVCRRQVKDGDNLIMKMEVVCEGGKEACDKLRNDFVTMNAQMQAEVDSKIKAAGGK